MFLSTVSEMKTAVKTEQGMKQTLQNFTFGVVTVDYQNHKRISITDSGDKRTFRGSGLSQTINSCDCYENIANQQY